MGRSVAWTVPLVAAGWFLLTPREVPTMGWIYSLALAAFLVAKVALALAYKPRRVARTKHLRVALVIPFYNEDETSLGRTIFSVIKQSRPPDHLIIVNDGSPIGEAAVGLWLPVLRRRIAKVTYEVFPENKGKRAALARAFEVTTADIVVTTDSDTNLAPDALEQIIKPFGSAKVNAVTGRVTVRNRTHNLLTRSQDLLYASAFLHERAALSTFRSVLITSGALGAYRRSAILPHLDDFLERPWMFGEDRHLTSIALMTGGAAFQESAVASTAVPETLDHYTRQQLRWQRGFVQNSLWILLRFPLRHRVFWLTFLQSALWVFLVALVALLILLPEARARMAGHGFILYAAIVSWTRLSRYFDVQNEERRLDHGLMFLFSPLLSFAHALFLMPVRVYALASPWAVGWGSRRRAGASSAETGTRYRPTALTFPGP